MFSRFKEKLSGFKEALSSKIAEKVSQTEKFPGKGNGKLEDDRGAEALQSQAKAISPPEGKSAEENPLVSPQMGQTVAPQAASDGRP